MFAFLLFRSRSFFGRIYGSLICLSILLEVVHWVAQTWVFFDKLHEITNFGLLQQSQTRAKFWICSVFTEGIANVKIGQSLTFVMPKKVFSKSFTMIKWLFVPLLSLKVSPPVVIPQSYCDVHLLRSPWVSVCPLLLNSDNVYFASSLIAKPST